MVIGKSEMYRSVADGHTAVGALFFVTYPPAKSCVLKGPQLPLKQHPLLGMSI